MTLPVPPASASPAAADRRAQAPRPRRRPTAAVTTFVVAVAAAVVAYDVVHGPPAPPAPRALAVLAARDPSTLTHSALPPWLPRWQQHVHTVGRGETLADVLSRAGVSRVLAAQALRAAGPLGRAAARPGSAVYTRALGEDSVPAEITFRPEADRVVRLTYLRGAWRAAEERLAWRTDTLGAQAVVRSSLDEAVHTALGDQLPHATRSALVDRIANIFEYRVDVSDDLESGDSVRLLVERRVDPEGTPREARILAARLTAGGRPVEAIRFKSAAASGEYFDGAGKSLRAAFLRAPLQFRRVSSAFGMRRHPILGVWKMHAGTDYAASSGTPVRTVGDGRVIFAGRKSGYGNVLEVRHRNGSVSRYGHLRGFAPGVRRGAAVGMGRTIGYVGMTGLATAPHLHFEMLVGGDQRDPRATLRKAGAELIAARERGAFAAVRARLLGRIAEPASTGPAHVALAE